MTILSQPQNYRAIQALGLLALVTALAWLLYPTPTTGQGQAGPGLEQRVAALEELLAHVHLVEGEINGLAGPHLIVEGCNLHVRNATGFTHAIDGSGNLIVGYNETILGVEERTGSHNFVVGVGHTYSNYGGFVAGELNAVTGAAASVSAGRLNEASGDFASVSGGGRNLASGDSASVSGGGALTNVNLGNVAVGDFASVSGGRASEASGLAASISGGEANEATGRNASVSGGQFNRASGGEASVSGGFTNHASGLVSTVGGGQLIEASDDFEYRDPDTP